MIRFHLKKIKSNKNFFCPKCNIDSKSSSWDGEIAKQLLIEIQLYKGRFSGNSSDRFF